MPGVLYMIAKSRGVALAEGSYEVSLDQKGPIMILLILSFFKLDKD